MACLSIVGQGRPVVVVANPVFVTSPEDSRDSTDLTFEVLEEDAAALGSLIGKAQFYILNSANPFWGQLRTLEPCESIHPGLAHLRHKTTLRGVLTVFQEATSIQ
jgi:hypothetical protein